MSAFEIRRPTSGEGRRERCCPTLPSPVGSAGHHPLRGQVISEDDLTFSDFILSLERIRHPLHEVCVFHPLIFLTSHFPDQPWRYLSITLHDFGRMAFILHDILV